MRNICAFDGREFEAIRADARYCSAACRAKASKARRRGEGAAVQVVDIPTLDSAEARDEPPEPASGNEARVDALERRLADLEADFDLAEARAIAVPTDKQLTEIVQRKLSTVLTPLIQRLQAVEKLGAQLRSAVDVTTRELAAQRALPVQQTERIDEIEQVVLTLAHRVTALRSDLDGLIEGLASLDT